nr:hypothetical protein [Mesorhizobium loti]
MSAMRAAECRFERQTNAREIRRGAIKPALCEPAWVDLAIDGRTAQVGQPGGILHGVCPVAKRVPRRMVRSPHCAAQHKKFSDLKYLCEQGQKLAKIRNFFGFWKFPIAFQLFGWSCIGLLALVDHKHFCSSR